MDKPGCSKDRGLSSELLTAFLLAQTLKSHPAAAGVRAQTEDRASSRGSGPRACLRPQHDQKLRGGARAVFAQMDHDPPALRGSCGQRLRPASPLMLSVRTPMNQDTWSLETQRGKHTRKTNSWEDRNKSTARVAGIDANQLDRQKELPAVLLFHPLPGSSSWMGLGGTEGAVPSPAFLRRTCP